MLIVKDTAVQIQVLLQQIETGQLADVASELEYVEGDLDRCRVLESLLKACCEKDDHKLVVKICQHNDTTSLGGELRFMIEALSRTCDVDKDFDESIPTTIGHCPF